MGSVHLFLNVSYSLLFRLSCTQEDINITQESGRVHIMGQTLKEKKGLLRAWILRDHGPGVRRGGGGKKGMERRRMGRELPTICTEDQFCTIFHLLTYGTPPSLLMV